MALSIEGVDLVVFRIVEALHWEVFRVRFYWDLGLLGYGLCYRVVEEVVMFDIFVVEKVYEDKVVGNEAASDERIWKVVDRHGMVV